MSIFSKIRDAIFGGKAHAQTSPSDPIRSPQITPAPAPAIGTTPAPARSPAQAAPAPVDVEANLVALGRGKDLNWKTSIVDLMKLLEIDSSLENRKELARELGYTGELNGSAEMNIWLHKATMRQLAANGGRVPAEMLD